MRSRYVADWLCLLPLCLFALTCGDGSPTGSGGAEILASLQPDPVVVTRAVAGECAEAATFAIAPALHKIPALHKKAGGCTER